MTQMKFMNKRSPKLASGISASVQDTQPPLGINSTYDSTLDLLSSINNLFAESMDLETTISKVVSHIKDYMLSEGVSLFMVSDDGTVICRECAGPVDITGVVLDEGEGVVGRVIAQGQAEVIQNVAEDPHFAAKIDKVSGFTTDSILCAPLKVHGRTIGALEAVNKQGSVLFADQDLVVFSALASATAMAIHSAQQTAALVKSEESLKTAQRIARLGNWDWNVETGALWWSDEIYRIFGLKKRETEASYEAFLMGVHPDDRDKLENAVGMALKGEPYDIEHRIVLPSGEVRTVHERGEVSFDGDANPVQMLGTVTDITHRKQSEEALIRANRVLKAMSNCNTVLVQAQTEQELLSEICRMVVETGGYRMAWVGYAENDVGKSVRPVASYGIDDGYVENVNATWEDTERGRGPIGSAVRTGKPSVIQNYLSDPNFSIWREAAAKRGYASTGTFPLSEQGQPFGVLNVYSGEANAFDTDEVPLLVELTNNFAYGILALRQADERKRAEETSRKLFQAVEQSSSTVVITDTQGKIEYVNRKFVETTGYSVEEALGKNPRLMKSGHTSSGEYGELWKTIRAGREWQGEFHNKRKDGTFFWEAASIAPIKTPDGTITNFLAIKDDVTDRKRVEAELKSKSKSVKLLERVAVSANEASSVNEALRTCLDLVCDHTGWPVGHVYMFSEDEGDLFSADIWHFDDPESFSRLRSVTEETRFAPGVGLPGRVLSSGRPTWSEDVTEDSAFLRAKRARSIGVKACVMFPVLAGDKVTAVLEFFSDEAVAPVPELLEVMTHVGTQIGRVVERSRANEEIVIAKNAAERASRTKSEFLANMSHELRTPLNAIIGFSEIMEGEMFGPLQSNYLEYAGDIKNSGKHLLAIISDILDLSKVEVGELEIDEEELDVAELLASCQLMVNGRAQEAGVTVTFEVPNDLTAIYADPLRLKQILLNLLDNAIKFTPRKGQITLTCEIRKDGHVGLTVSDTGIGIAEEDIPKVLEKFGQVRDGHTHAHEGSGLGLAIANALAELHGGTLAIESEVDKGTTVAVTIPRDRTAPTRQMDGFAQITTTQNH